MFRLQLEKVLNISVTDFQQGRTVLHMAAAHGHRKVVRLLLKKGADISARDNRGLTALDWAMYHRNEKVAQLLERWLGHSKVNSYSQAILNPY